MASILGIGMSALNAAQVGLTTTGHNIANAATPGYSRQTVTQATAIANDGGFGFSGNGTSVVGVSRVYSDFLTNQVLTSQTSQNELSTYYAQIQQVNNLLADPTTGLSPSMQDFFKGVQVVAGDPASGSARQTMLASAESLASKFQSLDGQLNEIREGTNNQIRTSISAINTYATQIAALNDAVAKAQLGNSDKPANDLLDQRDQVIADLSKQMKVSVVKQGDDYNIFVGNGQPLVVGNQPFNLVPLQSSTDLSRVEVGYQSNGVTVELLESSITTGKLGGLFEFRSKTLDVAQNSLGRIAIGLADTFNAQHAVGQDQAGAMGGTFFNVGSPVVTPSTRNTSAATMTASISNANALTTSDYQVRYDGVNYSLTRMSDSTVLSNTTLVAAQAAATTQGFSLNIAGAPAAGDLFSIQPTLTGASGLNVAITDKSKIAAAAPIRTARASTNSGSGAISAGSVDATFLPAVVSPAVTLSFNSTPTVTANAANTGTLIVSSSIANQSALTGSDYRVDYNSGTSNYSITRLSDNAVVYPANAVFPPVAVIDGLNFASAGTAPVAGTDSFLVQPKTLTGFPAIPVTVTANGVAVPGSPFASGTPVSYTPGATISFGGVTLTLSGTPANGDSFTIGANTSGVGDGRNALLLAALQTTNTLENGTSNYQGAYGQFINAIGNKTRELEVTSTAATALLANAVQSQQSTSGVNLDEEAANLLRYQQAYQAAGKVMQTADKLFDVLLSLGN